jgi:hypothetical protein
VVPLPGHLDGWDSTTNSDLAQPPLGVTALVPGREASTEMKGHNKYIAVAVALVGVATIGVAGGPAAAGRQATVDAIDAAPPGSVATESAGVGTTEFLPPPISELLPAEVAVTDAVDASLARPHVLEGAAANPVVRLTGPVCSGTPITGTVYVITAAHCVLTKAGVVTQRTVVRDGNRYPAVAVLVDTRYHDHPSAEFDAAVLVMAQVIPGPSARLGTALPDDGQLTLAGFQPIDSDGSLLRGHGTDDHPLPKGATGTHIKIPYRPAGCVVPAAELDVSTARVMVPCGLIPGASGGGLYAGDAGDPVLVGILSTVTSDLASNGIVPLASLLELLEHPDRYAHGFHAERAHPERGPVVERS